MRQGDLVVRDSYGGDVTFTLGPVVQGQALLKGLELRLLADAPIYDLRAAKPEALQEAMEDENRRARRSIQQLDQFRRQRSETGMREKSREQAGYFEVPGKVLHLDGDVGYLRKSMTLYKELRVPAEGYYVAESAMASALTTLLPKVMPDIVVLTGHDSILKNSKGRDMQNLASYKNSRHFMNAVHAARQFDRGKDSLVIIAGACQSHFEALLHAGANFASSPARVLIHALDPLVIAAKVAYTPSRSTVKITDVLSGTLSGLEGLGGIETRGSYRVGMPVVEWKESSETATIASLRTSKRRNTVS
ncbi:sporulation peptidase YabG [Gorillibacterium timonense]|uniref:sporulation peptidase YabG n=1 Tax=Gorillibacterium timonense TaxID=1689269 RepID=UPI00071E1827|nr:sporulation peptidase YabG [Gorillibacterium timonense]